MKKSFTTETRFFVKWKNPAYETEENPKGIAFGVCFLNELADQINMSDCSDDYDFEISDPMNNMAKVSYEKERPGYGLYIKFSERGYWDYEIEVDDH